MYYIRIVFQEVKLKPCTNKFLFYFLTDIVHANEELKKTYEISGFKQHKKLI
jgi:hypothetical protein